MQFLRKNGIVVYFLVLIVHCFSIYLETETLRVVTKLLLVPILAVWLIAQKGTAFSVVVYLGLLSCFAGDVLLLFTGELFFLTGMLCFIKAHVFNSVYFIKLQDPRHSRMREAYAAAVILILLSVVVFVVLNPYLGIFRIPVLVYMLIISIMAILAANTAANGSVRRIAIRYFIPGAALFVISDAVLAINKFMAQQPMLNIIVMATYGGALYFMVKGFDGTNYKVQFSK